MEREIVGKGPTFHRNKRRSNSYRILIWLSLILFGLWVNMRLQRGEIRPFMEPTPTATRIPNSYFQQAEAYFNAGKIDDPLSEDDAIGAYQKAIDLDPTNSMAYAELARILTYSSSLLPTRSQRVERLGQALKNIEQAAKLNPENSRIHGIYAFVLDWSASLAEGDDKNNKLYDALNEAMRAVSLDPNDGMSLAYYAEVQLDQGKWNEAAQYAEKAVALEPNSMDAHRVYATVLETGGYYRDAITQYEEATKINPNLSFLYIQIGINYRSLMLFDTALEYFAKAVAINTAIGVKDPLPYLQIAKVYAQKPEAEFFVAALNAERALSLDPGNANTYGQLGIIYFRSKNYESALPALRCAVVGCTADQNDVLKTLKDNHTDWGVEVVDVQGLPLESAEIAYYYAEYGQVLTYLSRPKAGMNFCSEARTIMEKVRAYTNDAVLMEMVDGSEAKCSQLEGGSISP